MPTAVNSGFKAQIFNLPVDSTNWTELVLPDTPNNVFIRIRGEEGDLKISLDAAGTPYVTIPNGQAFTLDWNWGKTNGLFIQSSIASAVAEVFVTY